MYALHELPLFSKLSPVQLVALQSQMHISHYDKESILFFEGDRSDYLQILLAGRVRLYKTSPKGTEIHMHHFDAPEIIALFVAFEDIPFPATCQFVENGTIGLIPLAKIYECMEEVDFSISLVTALSARMKLLANLLHKETIYTSEAKIADILLHNPTLFERLKKSEIASILNMTPETLSRILSKLKREGIIKIVKHVVSILDAGYLENIMESNHI